MFKKYFIVVISLLGTACATGTSHSPAYRYNELIVYNNSQESIQNMTITEPGNGDVISCDSIAALRVCANRFGRRSYKDAPFNVDWVFGNNPRQTSQVGVNVPAYSSPGIPLRVIIEISPEGSLSARLEQDTPTGGR